MIAPKAVFAFNSSLTCAAENVVAGTGLLRIENSGALVANANQTIANVELSGWINGAMDVTVTNRLSSLAGGMRGGLTIIGANGLLSLGADNGPSTYLTLDRVLINNGKVNWARDTYIRVPGITSAFRNRPDQIERFNRVIDRAWAQMDDRLEAARFKLHTIETNAHNLYTQRESHIAAVYQQRAAAAAQARDTALTAAQAVRDALPPDDVQADINYFNAVDVAETAYETAIETAANEYAAKERTLYDEYMAAVNPSENSTPSGGGGASYRQLMDEALAEFQATLRGAALPGTSNIEDLARRVHASLFPGNPAPLLGYRGGPGDILPAVFRDLTAEARASVAVAYKRLYPNSVVTDINNQVRPTKESDNVLSYLFTAQPSAQDPAPPPEGLFARLARWGENTWNAFRNLTPGDVINGVWSAAQSVGSALTTLASNTWQMARTNPLGLLQAVGNGILDTVGVAANALTFGLVPDLRYVAERALATDNGFFRAVNVVAIFAREVGATVLSGGAVTVGARLVGAAARLVGGAAQAQAIFCRITQVQRAFNPIFAYQQVDAVTRGVDAGLAAAQAGDYERAAELLGGAAGRLPSTYAAMRETGRMFGALGSLNPERMRQYFAACFAAGTPILGEHGARPVEEYRPGDRVWARAENNPNGLAELKEIEECFVTEAEMWHLHVGGQVIRTTAEHPIWVDGQGWTPTKHVAPGDVLIGLDGRPSLVEDVLRTGEVEVVYNFRVADHHTYFVGDERWSFSVWSHNLCAGLHHYLPRFMGSGIPYRHWSLTPLNAAQHTHLHKALNDFLRNKTRLLPNGRTISMAPSRVVPGERIRRTFSPGERIAALEQFYRNYQGGIHYSAFVNELRYALKSGAFSMMP